MLCTPRVGDPGVVLVDGPLQVVVAFLFAGIQGDSAPPGLSLL